MTHHPHRFMNLARAASTSSLCLGLLFACGGTTENDSDDTSGPTDGGPTNGGPTNGGPTNGGPTNGGPTSGPTTGGSPTTDGGNGGSGGTNNCPSVEPAVGSSCSENSQTCAYANCEAPDYRNGHALECLNGAWALVDETPCDDVPIECPPNVYLGAYCGAPEGTGPCTVYDACGIFRQVYCTNGYWQYPADGEDGAAPPPDGYGGSSTFGGAAFGTAPASTVTTGRDPLPECPPTPPAIGTPCCPQNHPGYCDYSGSGFDSALGIAAATGVSFTAITTGAGGTSGMAPSIDCAVCSAEMVWVASSLCP